jgi:hypothetical protein
MIPIIVIAATSLLTYTVAYLSTLTTETSLFAHREAVMRMRFARYAGRSRFAELLFSPMAFLDLMVRRNYWIQCDSVAIELENVVYREHLTAVREIAAKGGLVLWDSKSVMVSFARGAITDAELCVFQEFVVVDDLDLAGTSVTDAGLECLTQLSALRRLNVNNTRITDEAIARFRTLMPNCFVWNGK